MLRKFGFAILRIFRVSLFVLPVLTIFTIGLFCKRKQAPSAVMFSLSRAQVFENTTPENISRYLQQNRFKDLGSYSEVLFEVRSMRTIFLKSKDFTYDSSIYLLFYVLKRRSYLSLFREVISASLKNSDKKLTIQSSKRKFFDQVIWNEFIENYQKRFTMITTQSSLDILPEPFYISSKPGIIRVMMWYSTNSKPIILKDDSKSELLNLSALESFVDQHWVWNEYDARFLVNSGLKSVIPLGSIVFQEEIIAPKSINHFNITFFDVTPITDAAGFYTEEMALDLLNNVLEIGSRFRAEYGNYVKIRLKPKREYSGLHSLEYCMAIEQANQSGMINTLSPNSNLYSIISESDVVLSTPFTSPSVIARELNIETFYVAFNLDKWEIPEISSGVPVIKTFEDLYLNLKNKINAKLEN